MSYQETFREELILALKRELVGPDLPPHGIAPTSDEDFVEVLQESPIQRYSAGVLFPQSQPINEIENSEQPADADEAGDAEPPAIRIEDQGDDIERDGRISDSLADAYDETIRMANEYFPSAIGLTFLTSYPSAGLVVNCTASVYHSRAPLDPNTKLREWIRSELDIEPVTFKFPAKSPQGLAEFDLAEQLRLRAIYNRRADGSFLVTITMFNIRTSSSSKPPSGGDCFFQTGFHVSDPQQRFLFKEYQSLRQMVSREEGDPDAREEASLALLYRKRKAYAVGHGCSADWGEESDGHTNRIRTVVVPQFKVPPVEPRAAGGDELSMYQLSGAEGHVPPESIPDLLENLTNDYESWINDRTSEVAELSESFHPIAMENLKACRECLSRIRLGIALLRTNESMLSAFMLANRAILMQQYHSRRRRRSVGGNWEVLPANYKPSDDSTGRWRTFQIAFIIMNLPSVTQLDDGSEHADRELVDLMWFPTGGGKTEAYLGLAACTIFFRRLKDPANAGCTVLMRYTLRLLTAQQFQRASSMICACELLRRESPKLLGGEPITIGLWVGESLTPTHRQSALRTLNDLADRRNQSVNPFQLLKCPWCGTALDESDHLGYVAHKSPGRPKTVVFVCPEQRCPFSKRDPSERLPVLVIDDDIYEWPPTLIIGTVDKFAMLAWREQAGRIFGLGSGNGQDPPDLIIQDELHLISGPLGSIVGLYESAIELLCSWKGRPPKIIASTATIRRAWRQCEALYNRRTFQFPPQALDISDSFFAAENDDAAGREYVGVFASAAPSFVTAMVRALSALFQWCKATPLPAGAPEDIRDPYWTVLQYFNSLRELGHAATLVEADIPEYMWAIASRSRLPKNLCRSIASPIELTSRRTADEIPEILEKLTIRYPRSSEDAPRPLDTLLATNMISVGVDVDRLGLMVVVGQPKTTSEYIQASSRVGRSTSAPGLVVTMFNPGKPRDRSHYEHFRAYHAAFYRFVEPTSVTPFSLPALERALHAVLVILVRHIVGLQSPREINLNEKSVARIVDYLDVRSKCVDPEHNRMVMNKLKHLLEDWDVIRPSEWGRFGPPPQGRPLMYPAGSQPLEEWDDSAWPTLSSMRNVDVECDAKVLARYEVGTE